MTTDVTSLEEFLQRYEGHEVLSQEVCYSLPGLLIEAIQKHAPRLLSQEELTFEQSLARLPATGFFQGRPFSYPPLRDLHPLPSDDLSQRQQQNGLQIQTLLKEIQSSEGHSSLQIDQYHKQKQKVQARLNLRSQGFLGWLITHPPYQESCRELKAKWSTAMTLQNGFPQLPKSTFGVRLTPDNTKQRERFTEFMEFYRKWNLEGMVTWELPSPLSPAMGTAALNEIQALGPDVGVTLFLPWYLLIDKDLKVNQLVLEELQMSSSGVKAWLDRTSHDRFGVDRYADMLQLYLYLELALKRRYGEDLRNNIGRLDEAFAEFFQQRHRSRGRIQAESVKRIRERLTKRLKECSPVEPSESASFDS